VASKDNRRGQESSAAGAGKDEAVAACTPLLAQLSQQFDYVGDQVDVATLAVFRRPKRAARVTSADTHDRLLEIDVAPAKREEFPLPHACLERDEAQRPVGLVLEVGEQAR
jgi:hypothetical protein